MLDTARDVPTPEGIELSLWLAGPTARALAWLIDLVVRVAAIAVLGTVLGILGKFGAGLLLIVWFALEWFYPTVFEVWFAGATPGKRSLGLVVLHDDGTPIRLPASFTRNLLRAVDFMPVLYGFGLVSMLLSRDFKRLGDIAAGTVVVYREAAAQHAAVPHAPPVAPPLALQLFEQRAILDLATRSNSLTAERAEELAALVPHLTAGRSDAAALQRLVAIANHLIGRRGVKQQDFEAAHAARWEQFSEWLDTSQALRTSRARAATRTIEPTDVPPRYRELCQHLALARDRQYSAELIERLSRLALAGHQRLYGAHGDTRSQVAAFLLRGFPSAVRARWPFVLVACLLFFGPLLVLTGALQRYPEFAYVLIPPEQVESFGEMYGDQAEKLGRKREAGDDAIMFGFYIWNNVRIGFQTFAGGILFGLGALFYLLFNGLYIGTVMGYVVYAGFATNFFSFVSGHSAFELTAIALCGAAGLRLGYGLVAPGRLRRGDALRLAAREALPLVIGAARMLVLAAGIEAFWSPRTEIPPPVKYAVGAVLWLVTLGYFAFMGRSRAA